MQVKVGMRLRSTTCSTEVIVVRAPQGDVDVQCGGRSMAAKDDAVASSHEVAADRAEGTQVGKRYIDDEMGIELLVTKAGQGTLAVNGEQLLLKEAKALPSSD